MLNNDDLKQIQNLLEPITKRLDTLDQGQAQTNTTLAQTNNSLAHLKTAVEALAAGQAEIKETMATKADVQDLKATLTKKVNEHEERISDLEREVGLPHP